MLRDPSTAASPNGMKLIDNLLQFINAAYLERQFVDDPHYPNEVTLWQHPSVIDNGAAFSSRRAVAARHFIRAANRTPPLLLTALDQPLVP